MNASNHHGQIPHGRPVAIRHRHIDRFERTRTASCSIALIDGVIATPQCTSQLAQPARSPACPIFQFDPLEQVLTQLHPATPYKRLARNVPRVLPRTIRCLDDRAASLEAADAQRLRCNWEFRAAAPYAMPPANSHYL